MKIKFQKTLSVLVFISALLVAFSSCQREVEGTLSGGNPTTGVNDNIMVTAGVRGIVVDENNKPVMGATVTSGANSTTTDKYGVFHFNNIQLSKANGYVKVNKPGYFQGMRTFVSTAGRKHNIRIRLLPKTITGTATGSAGGTITLAGGAKLVLPANAVTDASGAAYAGTVNVYMAWIDPSSTVLPEILVGDLRGITTTGEERGLETFGMIGVELTTMGGQPLKIATGKTAELTFPIPASLSAAAPATIDLWNFDEATGRWKQEGQATKTGSNYIAQVSHFSFWNCDAPFPVVNLCMTLVQSGSSNPLNNVLVRIRRPNGSYASGFTDSLGNLCGKVPKDEALVLQVMDHCFNVVYSQNIGPYSADANAGTISTTIPPSSSLTITGTLTNCAGANVTSGTVFLYADNGHSYSVTLSGGVFTALVIRCGTAPTNFVLVGVDNATTQQSAPYNGSSAAGTVNIGTIQACGTSSAQYIDFLIDGTPFGYYAPPDFINAQDSLASPPYSSNIMIFADKSGGGGLMSSFDVSSNATVGTGPLSYCDINAGPTLNSTTVLTPGPMVNLTAFGAPSVGFVEGNFNIMMDFGGTPRNVICNFRIRRP